MEQVKPEDLLIVKCQKNMPIANVNAMHNWLCEMKKKWHSCIAERCFTNCYFKRCSRLLIQYCDIIIAAY